MKPIVARHWLALMAVPLISLVLAGGDRKDSPTGPSIESTGPTAERGKYLLAAEPAGAKPVKEIRNDAKEGDEVVVTGYIGGALNPWIDGRAVFWIVDPSIAFCPMEAHRSTSWYNCCVPKEEMAKCLATIKMVDDHGGTVAVDARRLLGVKEGQTVVVHGKAKRDDQGNLTVLADGVFARH